MTPTLAHLTAAELSTQRTVRWLLWLGMLISAAFGLVLQFGAPLASAAATQAAVGVCVSLTAGYALLAARPLWLGVNVTLVGAVVVTIAAATAVAWISGQGVAFVALAFVPVLLCAVGTLLPWPHTLGTGAFYAAVLVGLAYASAATAPASATVDPAVWRNLFSHLALLASAVIIGSVLHRLVEQASERAQRREKRFRGLLSVAADWYWEMDDQLRFTHVSEYADEGSGLSNSQRLGRAPWEIEDFGLDPEAMDAHRADLESRQPFSNLLLRRVGADGRTRWLSASGRPRVDKRGVFAGYWGVGRDVTPEHEAEIARAATEARYRELFTRSPSALVLHRDGVVLMANNAAAALFGARGSADLVGRSLLDLYDDADDSRDRAMQRMDWLAELPVGDAVPPVEFSMRNESGRRLRVLVTSVKVDVQGTPAVLSIYEDHTERLQAEAARARADALLAHVVATSPDLITLTDLATDRYVMVNDAYCRLTGYAREEVIGRTADELAVWLSAEQQAQLAADVKAQGQVRDRAVELRARDGRNVTLLVSAARFAMEGREYLVLNGRDVTQLERDRLEREAIMRNASIGIAMTRDQVFQHTNPVFDQMFGWPEGMLVGQPGSVTSPSEAAYQEVGQLVGPPLARGESVEFERQMCRRDGSTFLCRLLARPIDPQNPRLGGTIWVAEDVTERRAVEQALARARDAAEAANRAKSAFLANTSHEIRTPLNGLVGLARLARQPDLDLARRDLYLQQIDESARALSGVISDILDLSKIEAGKLRLEAVEFDLRTLLESVEHGYRALAEARPLAMHVEVSDELPRRVLGDPVRVRQILSNFLSNALKFTEQGFVRVSVRPVVGTRVRFEVEDSGPGIDPSLQARLFQPFTQADDSTTRRFGGTGLGLSICRQLAELMAGEVGVRSRAGGGSLFWAELPLPPSERVRGDSEFGVIDSQATLLEGLRVLIVEDNPVNMLVAVAMLEQWGVDVTQASNGAEAVAEAVTQADAGRPFNVILMDVQMPVQGGHDATRVLRQRFDPQELPIIALTAAALTSERDEALAAGMNDFLTKPIDAQRLRDALLLWRQPADATDG